MEIKCYVNYGVLAHEKTNVYTVGCPAGRAAAYETGTLTIPDTLQPYETVCGDIAIMLYGYPCNINDVLRTSKDGDPMIIAEDGRQTSYIPLTFRLDANSLRRAD